MLYVKTSSYFFLKYYKKLSCYQRLTTALGGRSLPISKYIGKSYKTYMSNNILTSEEHTVLMELKVSLERVLGDCLVKFVLYGSRAREDYDEESDIDIAIIVRGLTREVKNQILDMVADIELKYLTPLSTLMFSEKDFELLKKRERRIALDIEREGIPL